MKILITNSKGSVGKSMIAREVFARNLDNYIIVEIEGINASSSEIKDINVERFADFNDKSMSIILDDDLNVIIDSGASRVESLIEAFNKKHDIILEDEINAIIVPTTVQSNTLTDTINTIDTLQRIPILKNTKIIIVFNQLDESESVLLDNAINILSKMNVYTNKDLVIPKQAIVENLERNRALSTVFDDVSIKNLKKEQKSARKSGDTEKAEDLIKEMITLMSVNKFKKETNDVFEIIMKIISEDEEENNESE